METKIPYRGADVHVGLSFPLLKPQVSESFHWHYKHRQQGTRGFDLDDDFIDLCNLLNSVSRNAPSLPLLPALQFAARGHPLRLDVESGASGNIGWGIICVPPPVTDHYVLCAYGRWTHLEQKTHINSKELYTTLLTAFIFGDCYPGHWIFEAIDKSTAVANAKNNKARTSGMRRILKRRTEQDMRVSWTTAQAQLTLHPRPTTSPTPSAVATSTHFSNMPASAA